jgi:hypothetical protein
MALHSMIDISESNIHLPLLHHIWYLDAKSSTCSSPMYGSSRPSLCWSFFNHHHDPHNSCVFNEHMLIVIINPFSSFSLDEILLIFMMLKICKYIIHNICLIKWIASIYSYDIFPVSHLAKLISSLIILLFKHQNPQRGLDALSISPFCWLMTTRLKLRRRYSIRF